MKTEILDIKGNWNQVLNDCRSTISKPFINKEPSEKFKRGILMAEHSPIRDIIIRWRWQSIKSWISVHFCRHHMLEPRVSSQRNDRQDKYDRNKAPQDTPVNMIMEGNVQACIDMERKRLCNQAAPETREYAEDLKVSVHLQEPEIADAFVKPCVRCGACPEINNCGWYEAFLARHPEIDVHTTLQERYNIYNKEFYEKHPYIVEMENNENG